MLCESRSTYGISSALQVAIVSFNSLLGKLKPGTVVQYSVLVYSGLFMAA